ncbi:MAG: hypothetical protein WCT29_01105 [Candidatus Paceibacterota bacterium]|jgi:hypothetical protein
MAEKMSDNPITSKHDGKVALTPKELEAHRFAESELIRGLEENRYHLLPYFSENKIARVRIRDDSKKIVYDSTVEEYVGLCKDQGRHISIAELSKFHDKALEDEGM